MCQESWGCRHLFFKEWSVKLQRRRGAWRYSCQWGWWNCGPTKTFHRKAHQLTHFYHLHSESCEGQIFFNQRANCKNRFVPSWCWLEGDTLLSHCTLRLATYSIASPYHQNIPPRHSPSHSAAHTPHLTPDCSWWCEYILQHSLLLCSVSKEQTLTTTAIHL